MRKHMFIFVRWNLKCSSMRNIMLMFTTLILGTKKISVIACGQTSSMALSDAGEVGVKTDETRKF